LREQVGAKVPERIAGKALEICGRRSTIAWNDPALSGAERSSAAAATISGSLIWRTALGNGWSAISAPSAISKSLWPFVKTNGRKPPAKNVAA